MYETHKTKDGRQMLIAEMDDQHLFNTIRSMCRKMALAIKVIETEGEIESDKIISIFQPSYSKENLLRQAETTLKALDSRLPFYVVEAVVRGLDCTESLRMVHRRQAALKPLFFASDESDLDDSDLDNYDY